MAGMFVVWVDFDGTIVEVRKRFCSIYKTIAAEIGFEALPDDVYWACLCKKLPGREILEKSGAGQFFEIFAKRRGVLLESRKYLDIDTPRPGMVSQLRKISARYSVYMLSQRDNHDNLLWQLERLGLSEIFSGIFTVAAFGDWETKADAIAAHNPPGSGGLILGDTPVDIFAGRKNGLVTCAITNGMCTTERIMEAKPDHLIHLPEDLSALLKLEDSVQTKD